MNTKAVVGAIDPIKDVDGLHAVNQGKIMLGESGIVPCTPKGVVSLLDYYNVDLINKKVC